MSNPLIPQEAVIKAIRTETYDTLTFSMAFKEESRREEYFFKGGQFNMVSLLGLGEAAISLSSDPAVRQHFEHTVRAVGNVTGALSRLSVGDVVGVRGPYGTAWPLDKIPGRDVVIVAGGIGLAPLRPAIEHILGNRPVYGRVMILYGAKTPRDLIYTRDFDRWSSQPNTEVLLTVDRVDGESWNRHIGVVPTLFEQVELSPTSTVALVCGPEVMMRFVTIDLLKRGIAEENIFLSMERRMRCGIAQCGHCFLGPKFVCKDGPVFQYTDLRGLFERGV